MHSSFYKFVLLLFFVLTCNLVFAQIKFTASVSPENPGKDEYVTLRFTAENAHAIEKINIPRLKDFNIISGPIQESGMNNLNGRVREYMAISYVVQPKHSGRCGISAATATIAGKPYISNGLYITVGNASSGNNQGSAMQRNLYADPFESEQPAAFADYMLRKGENIPAKVNKNMMLKLQTDKTSVYVGEPVLATYKLYTRLRSETSLSKNPSFNGFSVVDMQQPDDVAFKREFLNGREYNVYVIRKAQLYPLQPGKAELEGATLENRIRFLEYSNDNDPGTPVTETVNLSSKPLVIDVKPLPESGKPASFKGAVGNYKLEAFTDKPSFSADETGKFVLHIGGTGNMHLLTLPDIQWPKNFEVFDEKVSDETDNGHCPISGTKRFEIPFSVQQPGDYTLPPVVFSFFDPATGSYKTITSKPVKFTVTAAKTAVVSSAPVTKKEDKGFFSKVKKNGLIILFLAGFVIAGLIYWMTRDQNKTVAQDDVLRKRSRAESLTEAVSLSTVNPLSRSSECLNDPACTEFYSLLNGEVKKFFANTFEIDELAVNAKSISVAMDKAGIDNDTSLLAQKLLRDINQQLYTPFENDTELHEMYSRAQTVIQMMNTKRIQSVNL